MYLFVDLPDLCCPKGTDLGQEELICQVKTSEVIGNSAGPQLQDPRRMKQEGQGVPPCRAPASKMAR